MKIKTMYAIVVSSHFNSDTRISSIVSSERVAKMNIDELNETDQYGDVFDYEPVTVFDYEEDQK